MDGWTFHDCIKRNARGLKVWGGNPASFGPLAWDTSVIQLILHFDLNYTPVKFCDYIYQTNYICPRQPDGSTPGKLHKIASPLVPARKVSPGPHWTHSGRIRVTGLGLGLLWILIKNSTRKGNYKIQNEDKWIQLQIVHQYLLIPTHKVSGVINASPSLLESSQRRN